MFIHWEVDPQILSALLPAHLEPELFDGRAYVGLVPFRMTHIRPVWLPAWFPPIPGISSTLETNVRTYVKRRDVEQEPIPAVWFFSLEAQSALAVAIARLQYGLPYFKAKMTFTKETDDSGLDIYRASSTRQWPKPHPASSSLTAEFFADSQRKEAEPGSIEYFLFERYALYVLRRGQLAYARVSHLPYRYRSGVLRQVDTGILSAAGLRSLTNVGDPLVHQADDVLVKIGALT